MDVITILILTVVIAGFTALLMLYVIYKKVISFIENMLKNPLNAILNPETLDNTLQTLINNEKFQKFLFEGGGLVGAGIKSGLGNIMGGGGGGKPNLKNIFTQLLGSYIQNKVSPQLSQGIEAVQTLNTQNNHQLPNKDGSKW